MCECEICGIKCKSQRYLTDHKKLMITRNDINVHHVAQCSSTDVTCTQEEDRTSVKRLNDFQINY